MSTPSSPHDAGQHGHSKAGMVALVAGAVGVVFGDIGTSPLYTIKEMFNPHFGLEPDAHTVKGLLSLGFWALLLVVTLKYVLVIMRADNEGEGGIMALTALAQRSLKSGLSTQLLHLKRRLLIGLFCRHTCGLVSLSNLSTKLFKVKPRSLIKALCFQGLLRLKGLLS